jgi:hypothetical protein
MVNRRNTFGTDASLNIVREAMSDVSKHVKGHAPGGDDDAMHRAVMTYRWAQVVSHALKVGHYCVANSINGGYPMVGEEFVMELSLAPLAAKPLLRFKDIGHSVLASVWSSRVYDYEDELTLTLWPCSSVLPCNMKVCTCRGCFTCRPRDPHLNYDAGLLHDSTKFPPTNGGAYSELYCESCFECLSYSAGDGKALALMIPVILDAFGHASVEAASRPGAALETLERHRDSIVDLMKYRCDQLFSLVNNYGYCGPTNQI